MRGRMRKESDDARQDDGKNENSILHVLAFVAFIAFVLAGVYLLVHHACAEKTMKPFLKGEYDGRWYKFESGVYTVQAKIVSSEDGGAFAESETETVDVVNSLIVRLLVTLWEAILSLLFHASLPALAVIVRIWSIFAA